MAGLDLTPSVLGTLSLPIKDGEKTTLTIEISAERPPGISGVVLCQVIMKDADTGNDAVRRTSLNLSETKNGYAIPIDTIHAMVPGMIEEVAILNMLMGNSSQE